MGATTMITKENLIPILQSAILLSEGETKAKLMLRDKISLQHINIGENTLKFIGRELEC